MDIVGEEHGRAARLASWLGATRAELAGLVVLLLGTVVATGALWWAALGTAPAEHAPTGTAGQDDHPVAERWDAGAGPVGPDAPAGDPTGTSPGPGAAATDPEPGAAGEDARLTVHVTGAVASPGVFTVAAGARVADAVAAAGEATGDGEPHRLNLARPLTDGEQVHVPREGEEAAAQDAGQGPEGVDAEGRVDLNRADGAALETLPGIGPARAEAIVEYREEHGPFAEPGDLRAVSGIGEATFQRVAEHVTVS